MSEIKTDEMVHLHTHSDMSQLDGCGRISEYVQVAKERGHKAACFTEHGTMRGMYSLLSEANERDIKPIFGIEFYVCADLHQHGLPEEFKASLSEGRNRQEYKDEVRRHEKLRGIRGDWHLTAWAKDLVGLRNLFKLSSKSWIEGFYYKPRIDLPTLFEHREGVAIGSACCGGILNELVCQGRRKTAVSFGDSMFEAFGSDFWLEIMPHNIEEQVIANQFTLEMWKRWGKKARIIATQDAHYIKPEDWEHHEVLLAIGTNDKLSNPDRFRFSEHGFHFRTRPEMVETFQAHHPYIPPEVIREALNNTMLFADGIDCKVIIDRFKCLMPPVDLPAGFTDEYQYLKHLCQVGWEWRDIPSRITKVAKREKRSYEEQLDVYLARLKLELNSIRQQKFTAYFLIVYDLYQWVRAQGIACGPGRGSAAGSLVSFLVGITSVDPIEHKLLFERFISPDRIDMPDIDMDFEDVRRQEIIEYLRQRYGADKVSQIATVGKLSGKQCLKDVSRVLEVPFAEVNQVTNSIIERSSGDERASQTILDSFKDFKVCREFNAKYPKVLFHATRLEGLAKNLGIHAAGVVACPVPLTDIIPMETRDHKNPLIVTALDMHGVQALGLLKMDVLGLRTMTVIRDALEMVKEHYGEVVDPERLDLNEPDVLMGFTDHDYVGVFQYDSPGADKICTGVKFTDFEDVAAMTALNRPGTARSGLATQYVARKKNPKLIATTSMHPKVSEITADTLGIIVYQEHVLKIFTEVAGFPPATADSLRKKIAKKWGDESIGKERTNFIEGAMKKTPGMTREIAAKIMDAITFFGCLHKDTPLKTPSGPKAISNLKAGAAVVSSDGGRLVPNKIKFITRTGVKRVRRLITDVGEVFATGEHWWQLGDGSYAKTDDLKQGDEFSCSEGAIDDNDMFDQGVPGESVMHRGVLQTLSGGVSGGQDGPRQSGGFSTQQIGQANRERLEEGSDQGTPINPGARLDYYGRQESSVEGRSHRSIPEGERVDGDKASAMPTLWGNATGQSSGSEREGATRTPQGQGLNEQQRGQLGIVVPLMSLQRTHGREIQRRLPRLIRVEDAGLAETWDLECENEPHNYVLSNGLTVHNSYGFNKSHATAYGMVAYWCMWLKKRYPLEFFCSLLRHEPDRVRIQQMAKDAKKHDIPMVPPDVSTSRMAFSIDLKRRAIRGSLSDIKFVGEAAAKNIMDNQPFDSFIDFVERTEGRKVHKRVVTSLAQAGALNNLVPNTKWFVEHLPEVWERTRKSGWKEVVAGMLEQSKAEPDWTSDDKVLKASKVNPLAFGKHPVDAYRDFIDRNVKVKTVDMSDEDFFKNHHNKGVYILGLIVEVKYNQIGDFHTGEHPSDSEKIKMCWGRRYANVNVECSGGKQNRIKVDYGIFDDFREIVDSGIGTPVIVHAIPNLKYENLQAQFLVNLEEMRRKIEAGEELNVWERIVTGDHPAKTYPWKTKSAKAQAMMLYTDTIRKAMDTNTLPVLTGVISHLKVKPDKHLRDMAYFGLIGANGDYIDCISFASTWPDVKQHVWAGRFVTMRLDGLKEWFSKKWSSFNKNLQLNEQGKIWILDSAKNEAGGKSIPGGEDVGAE